MAKHVWVNILETGFLCYTLYQRIVTIRVARPTEMAQLLRWGYLLGVLGWAAAGFFSGRWGW